MIRPSVILAALSLPLSAAEIRVSWPRNPEPDVDRYRVEWTADSSSITPGSILTDQLAVSVEALPGATYSFRVVALNTAGLESEASDAAVYRVPDVPAIPPNRICITLYSAETPSRDNKREEARFFQPLDGPRRFWWAEIETP